VSDDKEDKGFVVIGPQTKTGYKALRVTKEGAQPGEIYREDCAPECGEGETLTRIKTQQISGSIHEVIEEIPAGKPSLANSKAYLDGWENIFGKKQTVGNA
jgi:hypothetical protein